MDLSDRRAAVARRMAQEGVDLLIAASSGFRPYDFPDPVAFLSGYQSLGESLFVLDRDGAATLIVSPAWDGERATECARCIDAIAVDDVARELAKRIAHNGNARIATAGYGTIAPPFAARLGAVAATMPAPFDDSLYAASGRKTDEEIANARKATWIAERGFERMIEFAKPGLPECDLAIEVNLTMKALGADDNFMMMSAQPHARGIMPSSTRPLQRGDIILAEFTPGVSGQFIQICRTAVLGPPSAELVEKYALVVDAMWSGIKAVRPGARVADVCRGVDRVLEDAGFAEYCRPPHIRRRGHGFGLGSTWPGDIARDNDIVLAEGDAFVVHPNQYLPGPGYMLCGEPVCVTASGFEVLTQTSAALATIDC
ncbi:MAG TPA: M24 family metallopeptidase [Xanthobacteraceae bacterium]|nr:M24 family metallopeptidase [Xanthobacteraceae bacterium]